jgi:hypothetical protein
MSVTVSASAMLETKTPTALADRTNNILGREE